MPAQDEEQSASELKNVAAEALAKKKRNLAVYKLALKGQLDYEAIRRGLDKAKELLLAMIQKLAKKGQLDDDEKKKNLAIQKLAEKGQLDDDEKKKNLEIQKLAKKGQLDDDEKKRNLTIYELAKKGQLDDEAIRRGLDEAKELLQDILKIKTELVRLSIFFLTAHATFFSVYLNHLTNPAILPLSIYPPLWFITAIEIILFELAMFCHMNILLTENYGIMGSEPSFWLRKEVPKKNTNPGHSSNTTTNLAYLLVNYKGRIADSNKSNKRTAKCLKIAIFCTLLGVLLALFSILELLAK